MPDLVASAFALAPLGLYWILIGYLYQRKRVMLINATQDFLLLGMGSLGLVAIGPFELFFPHAAYSVLGEWVWFCLLGLYGFVVLFVALNRRPQWTCYGLPQAELKRLIDRVLCMENLQHAWLGDMLEVPELGLRAIVEPANRQDRASLLSPAGRKQDPMGWYRLERLVGKQIGTLASRGGGWPWIVAGIGMLLTSLAMLCLDFVRVQSLVQRFMEG